MTPVIEQVEQDGSAGPLRRSYWIGQTFIPSQPGLSRVSVSAKVNSAPATVRVELREVGTGGFPVMSEPGLLASGEGTLMATGDLLVDLPFSGFVLDRRQYALVFLRVEGNFEIQLHTEGTYSGGNLVRAYSLDWIHIPAFDCRFQTFDQDGLPDQGQATVDGDAFVHETGLFLTQTFEADIGVIGAVEVLVTETAADEVLEMQLRRTLPSGAPDLSHGGLLARASRAVSSPGVVRFETEWEVPEAIQGEPLALMFTSPQAGKSSIRLATGPGDGIPSGSVYESNDTQTAVTDSDLWVRVEVSEFAPSGTLTWDFDAESHALWTGGRWEADVAPGTAIRARLAFAGTQAGLDSAPWTEWMATSGFSLPDSAEGRWARIETALESADGSSTPTLEAFEVTYEQREVSLSGLQLR
jgi:hypothetical protein